MSQKKNVAAAVREIAEPLAESLGYSVWDVEYVKEGADMILRITIDTDAEEGITIDDCEKMHRAIDPLLDEADPIEGSYMLAVSSPGVERTLTRPEHFERMKGETVNVRFYTAQEPGGKKSVKGTLIGLDGDDLVLSVDGAEARYPMKSVSKCETVFEW